jgi:hypothetical protein
MPATPQDLVYAIVDQTDSATIELTFAAILDQIHRKQFTGPVTFHFRRGTPQKVQFDQPLVLDLGPRPLDNR